MIEQALNGSGHPVVAINRSVHDDNLILAIPYLFVSEFIRQFAVEELIFSGLFALFNQEVSHSGSWKHLQSLSEEGLSGSHQSNNAEL